MKRTFMVVGGVPSKVITLGGKGVEDAPKRLVLIIPGNPGLAGYYETFMGSVHKHMGGDVPVWAIGHAGHDIPKDTKMPPLKGNESLYSILGQVRHKVAFIEEHVPADCELTLVGHSVGCFVILQLLKHFDSDPASRGVDRIRAYMLFPMMEHMNETPNGLWSWYVCNYLMSASAAAASLLRLLLPDAAVRYLVRRHLARPGIEGTAPAVADEACVETTMELACADVVRNFVYMGYTEHVTIRELDLDAVRRHASRMRLYYGATDGWCPLSFCRRLRHALPELDCVVDERGTEHAFVLGSSEEMGEIVAEFMRRDYGGKKEVS